jgi:hypothetical protein
VRPSSPPAAAGLAVTAGQRAAVEARLGVLPEPLLHAVRDGRGTAFQRLEFLGDAVLELVVRLHADVAGTTCAVCGGDADLVVTDAALAVAARGVGLDAWLEWEPSSERQADLVEACAAAVWLTHGWGALARFVEDVVHPLAPVDATAVDTGSNAPDPAHGPRHEVLGASVLEVAAARFAYGASPGGPGELTGIRNERYGTARVVERALAADWLAAPAAPAAAARPVAAHHGDPRAAHAAQRDEVERRLAATARTHGLAVAVTAAETLLA